MPNTIRIVSPDNPHAMAAYALPIVVGVANLWKGSPPRSMVEIIGVGPSYMVLLVMIVAGILGMAGAWTASRVTDSLMSLRLEAWAVGVLAASLVFYIVATLVAYETSAVVNTVGMAASVVGGSLWRLGQVLRDIRRLKTAMKLRMNE